MSSTIARAAISTTRTLENEETGLDVTVPDCILFDDKKGEHLGAAQVIYRVVVVTNNHPVLDEAKKEKYADQSVERVAHFTLEKNYSDFLALRKVLDEKYLGTYVPELAKKRTIAGLIASSSKTGKEASERRLAVDKFMRWCAGNEKIATSELFSKFLHLEDSKNKAKEKSSGRASAKINRKTTNDIEEDLFGKSGLKYAKESLFEDDSEDEITDGYLANNYIGEEKSELFLDSNETTRKRATLFNKPDLTGNVDSSDKELIYYTKEQDAISTIPLQEPSVANENDLLSVEDDVTDIFSKLRTVTIKPDLLKNSKTVGLEIGEKAVQPSLDASTMEGTDLLRYINQTTENNDTLDLGF